MAMCVNIYIYIGVAFVALAKRLFGSPVWSDCFRYV